MARNDFNTQTSVSKTPLSPLHGSSFLRGVFCSCAAGKSKMRQQPQQSAQGLSDYQHFTHPRLVKFVDAWLGLVHHILQNFPRCGSCKAITGVHAVAAHPTCLDSDPPGPSVDSVRSSIATSRGVRRNNCACLEMPPQKAVLTSQHHDSRQCRH